MSRSIACGSGSAGSGLGDVDNKTLARFDLAGRLFYRPAVRKRHPAAFDQCLHAAAREGVAEQAVSARSSRSPEVLSSTVTAWRSLMEFSWRPLLGPTHRSG